MVWQLIAAAKHQVNTSSRRDVFLNCLRSRRSGRRYVPTDQKLWRGPLKNVQKAPGLLNIIGRPHGQTVISSGDTASVYSKEHAYSVRTRVYCTQVPATKLIWERLAAEAPSGK